MPSSRVLRNRRNKLDCSFDQIKTCQKLEHITLSAERFVLAANDCAAAGAFHAVGVELLAIHFHKGVLNDLKPQVGVSCGPRCESMITLPQVEQM